MSKRSFVRFEVFGVGRDGAVRCTLLHKASVRGGCGRMSKASTAMTTTSLRGRPTARALYDARQREGNVLLC